MKKAYIFDMDGTLYQTNLILEATLEATFDVLREEGLWSEATPIVKYREIMGATLPKVWETLCPNHSQAMREKSNELFHEKLIAHITAKKGALYPNAKEVLAALSKEYEVYIASNGQTNYLKAIVDTYELNPFLRKVYSIQSISSGDKSQLVKKIVEENDLGGGAVVGDRLSDINGAKDNGLIAIAANFDFAQAQELQQADHIIDDLKELLTLELF